MFYNTIKIRDSAEGLEFTHYLQAFFQGNPQHPPGGACLVQNGELCLTEGEFLELQLKEITN